MSSSTAAAAASSTSRKQTVDSKRFDCENYHFNFSSFVVNSDASSSKVVTVVATRGRGAEI